jgi:hypothetical protein
MKKRTPLRLTIFVWILMLSTFWLALTRDRKIAS